MRTIFLALLLWLDCGHAQTAYFPDANHYFGTVRQGARISHAFALRNNGATTLIIDKIEPGIPGVIVRFPRVVEPGALAGITLEWNTAHESGPAEGFAVVYTNDPAAPGLTLTFTANIQPPVEFQPFAAVFFTAYTDEAPERTVRIINHEDAPLRIDRVEAPKRFKVHLDEVRAGREYLLRVKVRPGGAPGRTTEPIYLHTGNSERPPLRVNANLFVKADLYAFPEEIAFGPVRLNDLTALPQRVELFRQRTVVTNRNGPVELRSVTSNLPFIRIASEPGEGSSRKFLLDLELDPAKMKAGEFRGTITIATNNPAHPQITIPVTGTVE